MPLSTEGGARGASPSHESFPWREAQWATLKRGDELVLVRAIGAQPDGSFIGEVFGLDAESPLESGGIRLGDQVAFQAAHVFAYEPNERGANAKQPLMSAEEALRHSGRLKDEFISTLSQEMRNPIAPMSSTIRFLQAKAPADLQFALQLLERQTEHVKCIVNGLLDLARIQSGTLRVRRRVVDLAWVLHSAIEDARHVFEQKRQHFSDTYPAHKVELLADSARLAEAVSGLLINASEYTPVGGRVELAVERQPDEVWIKVVDSGIGVPEVLRDRIFEPFVQGHGAEDVGRGLGIGLALAKSIVALHDGAIEVKCEGPGRGSEFLVRLPITTA